MVELRLVQNEAAPPARELSPLIARLGLHDEYLLTAFEGFGMGVIGRTVAQANGNRSLARLARETYGVEVLIDPETWRNQQPVKERSTNFQKAPFALQQGTLNLRTRTLSDSEMRIYARGVLEHLAEHRATILIPPYHVGGGPECAIRAADLRLHRRTASLFRSLRLGEPRAGDAFPVERRLFGAIAIHPRNLLDPAARAMLVHLYCQVEASGYFVKIVGLDENTPLDQITACADFVFSLFYRSSRDVILGGGRNLAMAFVGAGLPAAMLGIAEGEVFSLAAGGRNQGARAIYSSPLWRSVAPTTEAAAYRTHILFHRHPCDCGHHPSHEPPDGPPGLKLHTLKLHTLTKRLHDFHAVGSWTEANALRNMKRRAAEINEIAAECGYPPCSTAYVEVIDVAARAQRRAAGIREDEDR